MSELNEAAREIIAEIGAAAPTSRHRHLDGLNAVIAGYSRKGTAIPAPLRRLQEELTNAAIGARFDNMPV